MRAKYAIASSHRQSRRTLPSSAPAGAPSPPRGEGFGITDILRTQKAVERTALSEEMQKTEVDCWQEGGGVAKRNPLGHWFLRFPDTTPFTANSTYYLYAIPQKEINANPNL